MVTDFFNTLEGVTCTFTEGAMYSFPTIKCAPPPYCYLQAQRVMHACLSCLGAGAGHRASLL